ncbi:hypothetical protein PENCOP_c017G05877 [Penicillium coprophilum]|uniref:RelA/SpoT domain-containing protein n=1 Tax=Penicillium coprophilum TaxID=36646 RepID=A0A1V6U8Y5_9EURO|nr:hypothetical protein PENCOP_c017G05877 [Penicillium coprophilum]
MAYSPTSTAPEEESVVSLFIQQYQTQDIIHYRKNLNAVEGICKQVLSNHAIPHSTESRLKELASLKDKIVDFERKRGFSYQAFKDINRDIFDIAGVCISVHIPSDRIKASELLQDAFVTKNVIHKQKPSGYVATHIHVLLKVEDLGHQGLQSIDAKLVEIQVISTELRAWSNLEHDKVYKPKKKPTISVRHGLETIRMLVDVNENVHHQLEEVEAYKAAKEYRSLRSVDDVGYGLKKRLEEHPLAWIQGQTIGSCTSLFNFLKSRQLDTRRELRQVLELNLGPDSEAVWSKIATEYPAGKLNLVIFIMDRLLLTNGGSDVEDLVSGDDHQIHVYKLQAMMSTFVWLDRFFKPPYLWQQIFADQYQEFLREGLVLLGSTRLDLFLKGDLLEQDDIALIDRLWDWFEYQDDRQIRLTFAISKNGMFRDRKDARQVIQLMVHAIKSLD